jgi:hypothetical protein
LIDKQPDHYGWEARLVVGDGRRRAMAQVFRNHDPRAEYTVVFQGLNPGAHYDVQWADAGRRTGATGRDLMSAGVKVELPKPFSSEIIRLEARSAES